MLAVGEGVAVARFSPRRVALPNPIESHAHAPILVAAGCSKKVDVLIPNRRSNNLKLKARGTVDLRLRSDIDALNYRR
jgi:hypothetical protein